MPAPPIAIDSTARRSRRVDTAASLSQLLDAHARDEGPPIEVFRISAALSLLAKSLRDPDVMVRASLRYSPNPNPVQRETFVRAYLDAD